MPSGGLRTSRPFHAWLHYGVLRCVSPGVSVRGGHDTHRRPRRWLAPLRAALAEAGAAGRVQVLPLHAKSYEAMGEAAGDGPLGEALRAAWAAEYEAVAAAWQSDHAYGPRLGRFWGAVAEALTRCSTELWAGDPPPLAVLDVPALGRSARGLAVDGQRVVAVDLELRPEAVFARVLGEAVLADAAALDDRRSAAAPAWTPPAALERARAAVERAAVEMLPAFDLWCRRRAQR